MKSLDVSVEHVTLVWIICVRMLPFFGVGIFEGYSPQITTKNDISRKQPRVNAAPRSSAKNIPRINQWRDLRFIAGIVTSLGAVCGNIAGIFGPVADVSSNMDPRSRNQDMNAMNAAFPGNAPFLETVTNLSFTVLSGGTKKLHLRMCSFSWDSLVFFVACHLAIFQGVVDMVHLKITRLKNWKGT